MRALLAVLLLLTVAFAGCSDGGGEEGSSSSSSSSQSATGTGSGTRTSTGTSTSTTSGTSSSTGTSSPGNRVPTASVAVTLNGTSVRFNLTGADQDGDALSWSLAFGDGSANATGNALPANATHTYAVGRYTANLTVRDGASAAKANVTFNVTSGAAPSGPVQVAALAWDLPNAACGASYPTWAFGSPANGVAWAELTVDARTIGKPYTASFTYTAAGPLSTVAMDFYDANDEVLDGGFFAIAETSATGVVPVGATHAVFFDCFTAGGTSVAYAA